MPPKGSTFLVGMSGGVDSSFTALYLLNEGYKVVGATMCTWDGENSPLKTTYDDNPLALRGSCYGPDEEVDLRICREFCLKYGIPYYTIDVKEAYRKFVLDYFTSEYLKGRTPNPCVECNKRVKFGAFIEGAKKSGINFDYFATGHYARIVKDSLTGCYHIGNGIDGTKDQSYFLYGVPSKILERVRFPLGMMHKADVKAKALKMGLVSANRKESQDFIPQSEWPALFKDNIPGPGNIMDTGGKILGKHRGIIYYTIGQRRGLGIGGGAPLYVRSIDKKGNNIIVGGKDEMFFSGVIVEDSSLVFPDNVEIMELLVKIRLASKPVPARISRLEEGSIRVDFSEKVMAAAPGQSAVFYDGGVILGGGIIKEVIE